MHCWKWSFLIPKKLRLYPPAALLMVFSSCPQTTHRYTTTSIWKPTNIIEQNAYALNSNTKVTKPEKNGIQTIKRVCSPKKSAPDIARALLERYENGAIHGGLTSNEFSVFLGATDAWRCMARVFLNSKLAPKLLSFLMHREEGGVNLHMYNRIIDAAVGFLKIDIAEMLFDQMLIDKIVPDVSTYNSLIRGYMLESSTGKAVRIYQQMSKRGVVSDKRTYALMIGGHLDNAQVKEAHNIFEEMIIRMEILSNPTNENRSGVTNLFRHLLTEYKTDSQMDIEKWIQTHLLRTGFKSVEFTLQYIEAEGFKLGKGFPFTVIRSSELNVVYNDGTHKKSASITTAYRQHMSKKITQLNLKLLEEAKPHTIEIDSYGNIKHGDLVSWFDYAKQIKKT